MASSLSYIPEKFFDQYKSKTGKRLDAAFLRQKAKKATEDDFSFYFTVSAVASSQIEGNSLDLNSFMRAREFNLKNKEVAEIQDLIEAYRHARSHALTLEGVMATHRILSRHFSSITARQRGKIRDVQVGIYGSRGLVYLAVEPQFVKQELRKLFDDMNILFRKKLSLRETFYYASLIHLLFVKIHPFADGNGRSTRLLEKWFLSMKLGDAAWGIPSERYYWDHRPDYYANLNLGVNYYEALERMHKCVPFLLMLPESLSAK